MWLKTQRAVSCLWVGLCLVCLSSPVLPGQTITDKPSADAPPDVTRRLEELEREIGRLQAELARLRKEVGSPSRPAPEASVAPAPASPSPPASEPAPEASSPPSASFWGSTHFNVLLDGYYGYNFNHPTNRLSGLRSFDGPTNQFALNLVEFTLDKPAAARSRLGYHLAAGFGQALKVVNATEPGDPGMTQYLKEAYISYLAPVGKDLLVDFGKFVTPHGAEVIESRDNWNYSRGLLFSFAIPYYHFGLRAKYTFNPKVYLAGFLVNGWNNVVDNNTGKTVGVSLGLTPHKKFSLIQNYMAGPEQAGMNSGWRQLSDTLVTISPTDKLSFMVNYDYGHGDRVTSLMAPVHWSGVAAYARYAFNESNALAFRYEHYRDHDGFTTGTAQQINGVTGTFEHRIAKRLSTRWEFRRDMSDQAVFMRGNGFAKAQNTLAGGLMYDIDLRD